MNKSVIERTEGKDAESHESEQLQFLHFKINASNSLRSSVERVF